MASFVVQPCVMVQPVSLSGMCCVETLCLNLFIWLPAVDFEQHQKAVACPLSSHINSSTPSLRNLDQTGSKKKKAYVLLIKQNRCYKSKTNLQYSLFDLYVTESRLPTLLIFGNEYVFKLIYPGLHKVNFQHEGVSQVKCTYFASFS